MATYREPIDQLLLTRLTPVCASCARVRDAAGLWVVSEPLPAEAEDTLTHTICPRCLKALYPEFLKRKRQQAGRPD